MADTAELAAPAVAGPDGETNAAAAKKDPRQRRPEPPDDFRDDQEFLRFVREEYGKDTSYDDANREELKLDTKFLAGEQWEQAVKQRRTKANKPTLTVNRLPAFVAQLVGNRRLNDTGIKVVPDTGGDRKIAEVREGLIRSIEKNSRAQSAYDKAFEQAVIGGLGNFQLYLNYAHDDVFEQDIQISAIPDPLAVVWDRNSVEPSGSDAGHVFVVDRLSRSAFMERYPKAQAANFDGVSSEVRGSALGWDTRDTVQIVSFWRVRSRERTVAMLATGAVEDITDWPIEKMVATEFMLDREGVPVVREVQRRYAQMHLCSSTDILAGPYELPIQRVPVFRVPGWEIFLGDERWRFGMVRFLRDPQKLLNYWRSVLAEKLIAAPKHKWLAADTAVEGYEKDYEQSSISDNPLLRYRADSGQKPERADPLLVEPALLEQAALAGQDLKDVSNVHEANLGIQSNEVSGVAIAARQRVGELGTVIYVENLNIAIEECGKVTNQLIPFVYGEPRIIKVLGKDMLTEKQVPINMPGNPASVDITLGKYGVSVVTGPSYSTRRMEAREEMMAMVNAMPETMGVAADKIVEAQDWPEADEIARRLRTQLPPGMIDPEEMTEQEQAQMQQSQAAAQQQAAIQQRAIEAELLEKEASARLKLAQAGMMEAQSRKALADAGVSEARIEEIFASAQLKQAQAVKTVSEVGVARITANANARRALNPPKPAGNGAK